MFKRYIFNLLPFVQHNNTQVLMKIFYFQSKNEIKAIIFIIGLKGNKNINLINTI